MPSHKKIYPQVLPQAPLQMDNKTKSIRSLKNQTKNDFQGAPHSARPPAPQYDNRSAKQHAPIVHRGASARKAETDTSRQDEWGIGLLSCLCATPNATCTKHFICPCMTYGTNVEELMPQDTLCPASQDVALCGGSKYLGCCCWTVLQPCGMGCLLTTGARRAIRSRYGIKSGMCPDYCATFICPLCALHQEAMEFKRRRDTPDAFSDHNGVVGANGAGDGQHVLDACLQGCLGLALCRCAFSSCGYLGQIGKETGEACWSICCGAPDQTCCSSYGEMCGDGVDRCKSDFCSLLFGDMWGSSEKR
mmetsp:Transcript_3470/g.6913  ORF Transcript_3470/g.6913 Transcript_3470/m.6913 type:complete len:305 (+) Transcript_3470:234-1148(+)|eukprot:CAMPEP_0173402728 /NCGR_PEP_ID=MMETSP1356-20130122/54777_1 /TAXON_ID=77927 ORGANISM="Hemiselmis virescens, Strain PCC157" /NCGR_SAMPLE_ID=MMETSP1356 /ASSEMBLY_ACC=CAM_ASM_000847 /LENGTH=304 /DNA_ID=CAMNT_0014363119 /DNA_START=153 /DNA_END=1067 /DNA_ORIENTATION=+